MDNLNKMRPKELFDSYRLMEIRDGIDYYVKEYKNFIPVTKCPACQNEDLGEFEFKKSGYEHIRCQKCKTFFVSPRPKEEKLFEFYNSYESLSFLTNIFDKTQNERKKIQFKPKVEKLKNILSQNSNEQKVFIDIGAGNGNFAESVKEANIFHSVIACDINKEALKVCEEKGLSILLGSIEQLDDDSIDCITANDVIEHMFNPLEFFELCFKKLKHNGILMVSTPNGEGFDFKILNEQTENLSPPMHLQYFNPYSLEKIIKKVGLEVLDISTPGVLDVEIVKKALMDKKIDLGDNKFISFLFQQNSETLEKNFQKFIMENRLSSHMVGFAKKDIGIK